jgi:hypothetical protein
VTLLDKSFEGFPTVDGATARDELVARGSVRPRGGNGEVVEPGLRAEPCRTTGDSILRGLAGGLNDPTAARLCECKPGLLGLAKGDV